MRNFNKYDVLFVDVDSTIIYGFWTQLMHHTWNIFHSNTLSHILMTLQNLFNLYTINKKLQYILQKCRGDVVFITVRKSCPATTRMLTKILGIPPTLVYELGTDNAAEDKFRVAAHYAFAHSIPRDKIIMIDDNFDVRHRFAEAGIDVIDPTGMYDEVII